VRTNKTLTVSKNIMHGAQKQQS